MAHPCHIPFPDLPGWGWISSERLGRQSQPGDRRVLQRRPLRLGQTTWAWAQTINVEAVSGLAQFQRTPPVLNGEATFG
jgi:hypothetical protein